MRAQVGASSTCNRSRSNGCGRVTARGRRNRWRPRLTACARSFWHSSGTADRSSIASGVYVMRLHCRGSIMRTTAIVRRW